MGWAASRTTWINASALTCVREFGIISYASVAFATLAGLALLGPAFLGLALFALELAQGRRARLTSAPNAEVTALLPLTAFVRLDG